MTLVAPPPEGVVVEDDRLVNRRAEVDAARSARRRRRWRRGLTGVASIAVVVVVGWGVAISPLLAVRHIEVLGADGLDPATVRRAAGVTTGQAVWSLDASTIEARLGGRAELRSASVSVRWPDTVEIRVAPRRAVARLVPDGGTPMVVAAGGVVLRTDAPESASLMTVAVPDLGDLGVGDRIPERLVRSVDVVGRLPVPIALRVVAAEVDADGDIRLMGRIGVEIRIGSPDDIDAKLRAVEATLSGQVDLDGMCALDVRNPRSAIVRRNPDCDPSAPAPVPPTAMPEQAAASDPAAAPGAPSTTTTAPPTPGAFGDAGRPEPEVVVPDDAAAATTPTAG